MPKRKSARRKKDSSWKIIQLDLKTRRRLKIFFLAIMVLFSTGVVYASIAFYNYLNSPLVSAADGTYVVSNGWDRDSRYNVLLIGVGESRDNVSVISYLSIASLDPQGGSLLILDIPRNFLTDPEMISIGHLSDQINYSDQNQIRAFSSALGSAFGIRIDSYIIWNDQGAEKLVHIFGDSDAVSFVRKMMSPLNWVNIPELYKHVGSGITTNMRVLDILNCFRFLTTLRPDKVISETVETDWFFSKAKLSGKLRTLFSEKSIIEEGQKIVVLNGTGETGLASKAGAIITQLGGDVIEITNTNESTFSKSVLVVRDFNDSYTKRRLIDIFKVKEVREVASFSEDPLYNILKRSDLSLILGLDRPDAL